MYPFPTTFCYKVKDLTTGFWKGAFLHSLLPSQFQHIGRSSKCLERREIIFQNITNGLGTNCMSSSKKKKLWKLLSIIKSGSRKVMLYNTYWPAGRVGRCYPQSTVSPIIGRGKRHARNRGKSRWNLKDSLRLTQYFRLMFLHKAAGKAEPAPGSRWAGSLMPRLQCETTSSSTTIPTDPSCQPCSYPSTQTHGLLPLGREVLLWPRPGTEPGWQKELTKNSCREVSEGSLLLGQCNKKGGLEGPSWPYISITERLKRGRMGDEKRKEDIKFNFSPFLSVNMTVQSQG